MWGTALTPPLSARSFSRILLIKPTAMGDVVHTVPVLVKLRRRYPQAQIDWLVTPENAELIQHHPALSNAVLWDRAAFRRHRGRALLATWRLLRTLRRTRYELVIDLHGQLRSGLFALAAGGPVRIGFARPAPGAPRHGWAGAREGAWLAYTVRMPVPTLAVHAVDRYLWLGPLLGLDAAPPDLALHLPAAAHSHAAELLAGGPPAGGPLAVVAPATLWETKHWRPEGFAETARALLAQGWRVAVVGTSREAPLCRRVVAAAPGAVELAGRTTPAQLAALLAQAQLCVANDSGAMHLAVAMGVPTVPVFGPTNPVTVGPYGQLHHVVRAGLPCSPCGLRRLAQCPHGHACMGEVPAAAVLARAAGAVPGLQPLTR